MENDDDEINGSEDTLKGVWERVVWTNLEELITFKIAKTPKKDRNPK